MEKLYMSQEGFDMLKADLAQCMERRRTVADAIEHARGFGDLRENADYHAAKEEQAMLAARVRDIEDKMARAVVVDASTLDADKAYLGATVRVRNRKTQREHVYVLTSPVESDIASGKISVQSPVGRALLGKTVGDTVVAQVPAGALEFEILEISR